MFANMGYPSVADIAAVQRNNGNCCNSGGNGMFGDGWWVLIILLAMWGGFGGNGWGGGSNSQYYTDSAVQRGFDNQSVMNKLNGLEQGLCSLGYDQLAQMNTINSNIMQTGYGIQQAINADTVANMQNTNALSRQLGDCCCENRAAIKDVQYAIAQNGCDTRTQIHETGDAINNNMNWNFRDLNDTVRNGFQAAENRENLRYIRELEAKVNTAERKGELAELYNNLIAYLAPQTRPAYLSCNPNTGMAIPQNLIDQIVYAIQNANNCGCNCNPCGTRC